MPAAAVAAVAAGQVGGGGDDEEARRRVEVAGVAGGERVSVGGENRLAVRVVEREPCGMGGERVGSSGDGAVLRSVDAGAGGVVTTLPPRRILIYGVTGSGKTTLARRLGEVTGLPWHSMDGEVGWLPNWVERPPAEQRWLAAGIVAEDAWVLDTAYGHWRDLVLPRAELIVALDYPRWVSLARLLRRTVRRSLGRERVCNGNVESVRQAFSSDSIVLWHFRSFARKRRQIAAWEADPTTPPVVRLQSSREADRWLTAQQRAGSR